MWTSGQAPTVNAMVSTVGGLIFLATVGQNIRLADGLKHPTLEPSPSDLMPITHAANNSTRAPPVLRMHHAPCREEHATFCFNEGRCMYPQDMENPSCICRASYGGPRCLSLMTKAYNVTDYETVVGICTAVFFFILFLILALWWIRKRCIKKSPQKYAGPETAV
ncbi:epigen-like [Gadus chalcogrammus]|uniref:epigen-like n=1 Tax=Gadus chalcogrammus TaxID=1042646 RepID=UPI0024C4DCD5|nr:epigen-like [Gadus chalcogrammus]